MRHAPSPLVEDIVEIEIPGVKGLIRARIKEIIGPDGDTYSAEVLGGERVVIPWYSIVSLVEDEMIVE